MKLMKTAFASFLTLSAISTPLYAAENETGSITVQFPAETLGELTLEGSVFGLYNVAQTIDGQYELTESFTALDDELEALELSWDSFADPTGTKQLNEAVDAFVKENEIEADVEITTGSDAYIVFDELQPGIYFVKQLDRGNDDILVTNFLATIPFNEVYDIQANTKASAYTPQDPNRPTIPDDGTDPENPENPDNPDDPDKDPNTPTKPGIPDDGTDPENPDDPSNPSTPGKTPNTPSKPNIPNSGMDAWMIPFLAIAGLFFLSLGVLINRKESKQK